MISSVVDTCQEGLGIFRKLSLAFGPANAVLGWDDKVHVLISNELGGQSLRDVAHVVVGVGEAAVKDGNDLADILEWIVLKNGWSGFPAR